MNKKDSLRSVKKPKYVAVHSELVWAHIIGVSILVLLTLTWLFVTSGKWSNTTLLFLFVATFVETFLERHFMADARREEREFVQWKRKIKKNGQFQNCECELIHDYENNGLAMIVGKLRLPKSKSLYFNSPKFRWKGDADLNVVADIWYMPSDRLVYIQKFRLSEKDC